MQPYPVVSGFERTELNGSAMRGGSSTDQDAAAALEHSTQHRCMPLKTDTSVRSVLSKHVDGQEGKRAGGRNSQETMDTALVEFQIRSGGLRLRLRLHGRKPEYTHGQKHGAATRRSAARLGERLHDLLCQ